MKINTCGSNTDLKYPSNTLFKKSITHNAKLAISICFLNQYTEKDISHRQHPAGKKLSQYLNDGIISKPKLRYTKKF